MAEPKLYLKQNVLAEPLWNQWYAWSGLIFPATAAMYISNSHIKIMRSFVEAPQVHIAAMKNPKMIGGPFINYGQEQVGAIKELLTKNITEQSHMLKLAEAIQKLDEILVNEANGLSLEPLYGNIPDALRGYVELTYDLNNHASMRFIESLLYKSRYYNAGLQSLSLSLLEKDERHFVFSTPRLPSDSNLHLNIAFIDERVDELFKLKTVPQTYNSIKAMFNVEDRDDQLFSSFFTEEPPRKSTDHFGDEVRIRYFGHACVLMEANGICVLSDPVISYEISEGTARYSYADLPEKIDYAFITHGHQDHFMFETLLQLRHRIGTVIVPKNNQGFLADLSLKLVLQNIGFQNVVEIGHMEAIGIPGGSIMALPFLGEHGDLDIRTKAAYLVNLNGVNIMLAADSNNLDTEIYKHIHEITGDIDVLFIGMECDGAPLSWIYGPLLTKPIARKFDQTRRLNGSDFKRSIEMVNQFNPKHIYVYAMGQEPWMTHVTAIRYTPESRPIIESDKLVEECKRRGRIAERVFGRKEILLPSIRR